MNLRGALAVGSLLLFGLFGLGCSSSPHTTATGDGGTSCSSDGGACSKIQHVVIVIQENHSFDSYFGKWCTAKPGSNPTCNAGPSCCEAGPATDPSGSKPVVLNDQTNNFDPNHASACETVEVDGGKMDKFVTGGPTGCSDPQNFAYVDQSLIQPYLGWAKSYALADRFFQPVIGASIANDMYYARAQYVFADNTWNPNGVGANCAIGQNKDFTGQNLGDLLNSAKVSWAWYGEGYQTMVDSNGTCPTNNDCPAPPIGRTTYPCVYTPGDVPFAYYPSTRSAVRDFSQLAKDLMGGSLPAVSYVKALGYKTEHPEYNDTISAGVKFVNDLVTEIEGSSYADSTLVLVTYDESGGYFDHVAPPATSTIDNQPYGARVPFMAIGPMVRSGYVSHVQLEPSSIVKFIEWNWLGGQTGQLKGRDAVVANLGDFLDPAKAGAVPTK